MLKNKSLWECFFMANVHAIKIDLEDIKKFLIQEDLKDIDSVYMELRINGNMVEGVKFVEMFGGKTKFMIKSGEIDEIPKDKRDKTERILYLPGVKTINQLVMFFYECKDDKKIDSKSTLTLYKNYKELYFGCKNKKTKIKVTKVEENKNFNFKSTKENSFAFSHSIFFGQKIDYLVYAIFKKNKEFIDFSDAKHDFQYLFCIKRGNVWIKSGYSSIAYINSFYDITFDNYNNVEIIDKLKVFIRHENYKNFLKDKEYDRNILDNNIGLNELRRKFFEIAVKKNEDETGFPYKLVDCNGNLISYAVNYDKEEEVQKLTDYLRNTYENSAFKEFMEKFDLASCNTHFVLKDKVEGIYLTDVVRECVFLGTKTKLVFTKEFLEGLKNVDKSDSKFYVLPQSRALRDIVGFILRGKCLPFENLFFISEEIAKSYDTKKHIDENLDGKDMVTLRIYNLKIDPNLQSDNFSDDLTRLCEIDDGLKCAGSLIKLLSKIKVPDSYFEYRLSSFKNGELILETNDISQTDISKTLGQTQNNTEQTSWLTKKINEVFKMFKSQRPYEKDINDEDGKEPLINSYD